MQGRARSSSPKRSGCRRPPARRIRQLEETGIIRGYRADLEPTALGLVTTVVVTITLEKQSEEYSPR